MITAQPNSPQAVARVVALAMAADASFDPREVEALERLDAFARIGLTRAEFLHLARDLYGDLMCWMREAGHGTLVDDAAVDRVAAGLTDPALRKLACALLVAVLPADGRLGADELAVFQRLLHLWQIPGPSLQEAAWSH